MTRYWVEPRDWIFVEGYGVLSFAKNLGRNTGKNMSKNWSSKYSKKIIDQTKPSAADAFKTDSKRAIQKTVEGTDDLIPADKNLLIKLQEFQKLHQRIIRKKINKKYLQKDLYPQN